VAFFYFREEKVMIFKPFMREGFMPLPVTFISTISLNGVRNIAPWSCVMPVLRPLDLILAASAKKRDTLRNIRETGEFVLNLAGTNMADKVIPTARHSPPEEDEFETAGLGEKPSAMVKAPGIAGCHAWMECELVKEYEENTFVLLLGRVLRLEVSDEVLDGEGALDVSKANPLMMTGSRKGMNYCTVRSLGRNEPFCAMFPDGRDPLAGMYGD
jgi:flavin reductase (DIM6/NTAB) family NADH-FMN oxidoreductase RutF